MMHAKHEEQIFVQKKTMELLVAQWQKNELSLDDFKKEAMSVAKQNATLTLTDTSTPAGILLYHLLLNNKNKVNDNEITQKLVTAE